MQWILLTSDPAVLVNFCGEQINSKRTIAVIHSQVTFIIIKNKNVIIV